MSQTFEKIKQQITNYRQELESKRVGGISSISQHIEEDRALLESSGVRQIFEEIRDSGLVKLKPVGEPGFISKIFGRKHLDYAPAEIVDKQFYLSICFDKRSDGWSEVRIAAINGVLSIAHGYNRVDYTPIEAGHLDEAIIEGLKNPLRVSEK